MLSIIKKLWHRFRVIVLFNCSYEKVRYGKNVVIGSNFSMSLKNDIAIGDNVFIGRNCHIASDISIQNDVLIASYVSFVGGDHKIDGVLKKELIRNTGRDIFKRTIIPSSLKRDTLCSPVHYIYQCLLFIMSRIVPF